MRQVTATEKYNAVLEGKMAKKEFVRQMRQKFPMYVSQYNGFDDTVQILKNKQMIFEIAKPAFSGVKVYDDRPALTYSLDALDRAVRIELGVLGLDPATDVIKKDDLDKATKKAKDNLEKDSNHYINLMAGESKKVDKQDQEREVKRGAKDVDVLNGMKKATLKEEVDPNPPMSEDAKKALLGKVVGALRTDYPDVTAGIIKDFIKMHGQDLLDGADIQDEFEAYIAANYQYYTRGIETDPVDLDKMVPGVGPDDYESMEEEKGKDIDMSSKDGYIAFIDNEDILGNYGLEDAEEMARELAMNHHDAGQDQDNFVKSFMAAYKEGGYMTDDMEEKKGKDHDGDGDIDGDDYMAAKDKAIKKAMGKDESYAMKRMQQAHDQDRRAGKKSTYDIAKEKQAEKEKQLKEAIKSIIKKTLNEDVINEAATSRLSQKMDDFGGYAGAQGVINSLENIVTEVESFYGKVRDKIQKVYDDMDSIENEEGLKIGPFIGPSIESAFMQDLRPVTKKGFTKDLSLPKAKQLDPAMVAQAKAAGEIDETPEDPKATVFTPNF
tara:strand:- start:441 stop:2093 length:1653 start_codon:yes stop_codon:yes gene_type:complete